MKHVLRMSLLFPLAAFAADADYTRVFRISASSRMNLSAFRQKTDTADRKSA